MTFLGFCISKKGDLLDPTSNHVLEKSVINPTLRGQLKRQGVDFDMNYEKCDRYVYTYIYYYILVPLSRR